jgi:hypothetical protein
VRTRRERDALGRERAPGISGAVRNCRIREAVVGRLRYDLRVIGGPSEQEDAGDRGDGKHNDGQQDKTSSEQLH